MSGRKKVSEAPEAIAKILAIVRLLPPKIELIDFWPLYIDKRQADPKGWFSDIMEAYGVEDDSLDDDLFDYDDEEDNTKKKFKLDMSDVDRHYTLLALEECLKELPTTFVTYVNIPASGLESLAQILEELHGRPTTIEDVALSMHGDISFLYRLLSLGTRRAVTRYDDARIFYRRAYALAEFVSSHQQRSYFGTPTYYGKTPIFAFKEISIVDGRVRFIPDAFTEAFEGVDPERIGLCPVCGRVFWRKRLDMQGCTIQCAKNIRTRRWREKVTGEQKQKYKVNRAIKELKQDKNTTNGD